MLAAAFVSLPNFSNFLVASVYAPKDPTLKNELQTILESLMKEFAYCIFMGDFNCTLQSLDVENVLHAPKWQWLSSAVYPAKPKLLDTFRTVHPLKRSYTSHKFTNSET